MHHFSQIYNNFPKYQDNQNRIEINQKDLVNFNKNFLKIRNKFEKKNACVIEVIQKSIEICYLLHGKIFYKLIQQTEEKQLIKFFKNIENVSINNLKNTFNFYLNSTHFKDRNNKDYKNLKKKNYYKGKLSDKTLQLILDNSKKYIPLLFDKSNKGLNKRSDLTVTDPGFNKIISKILNQEFKKNGTLTNLKSFFGYEMIVTGAALELSSTKSNWWKKNNLSKMENNLTSYIHTDESVSVPKSIIYLSDVNEDNGPLTLYPGVMKKMGIYNNPFANLIGGTMYQVANMNKKFYKFNGLQPMSSKKFEKHFMQIPSSIRLSSHFGWDIKNNSKLEKLIEVSKKTILGKKGSFTIFDGYSLLHRGGILKKNYRIALQVNFRKKISKLQYLKTLLKKLK